MKLDRVSAIVLTRPTQPRTSQRLPTPGESLLLTYGDAEGADVLATTGAGLALRLAGLSRWRQDLLPGDTLRVRVLANEPVLELEVQEAPTRAAAMDDGPADTGGALMNRQAAMRVDQAALRQMAWQAPNAPALAVSWRSLAQERWSGRAPVYEGIGDGSTAAPATMLGPAPFREPASSLPPPNLERWLLPVYAWGGTQMMLGLLETEEERDPRQPKRRKNRVLRLELAPAALGRIVLEVQWVPGGIQLLVAVEEEESVQLVREALPLVAATLTRAGLQLLRFRLQRNGASAVPVHRGVPDAAALSHFANHNSSAPLFRAVAEAAVVLLQVLPGHLQVNRASR